MRRDLQERIRTLEAKAFGLAIPIDFLGVWDECDPQWETVKLVGVLPPYVEDLIIQRHRQTGALRGLFDSSPPYPQGADLRFL